MSAGGVASGSRPVQYEEGEEAIPETVRPKNVRIKSIRAKSIRLPIPSDHAPDHMRGIAEIAGYRPYEKPGL
jgi:hypothetical protein